jgi:hypothetical protein
MHTNQLALAKSSIKKEKTFHLSEEHVTQWTLVKCGQKKIPMIDHWMKLSRSGQWPNVAKTIMPLIGGHCLTADFDQMWPKMCPSLEDFVMQRTLTKCGPKCAPSWRTLSRSGLLPNVARMCPSLKDFVSLRTSTKCGPKCAPHWRTLSCSGL